MKRLVLIAFLLVVARPTPEVHASGWNPIAAVKKWVGKKVKAGAASLAEAASAPVARNLEASGKKLLDDAERAIARRLDQAETVTTRVIAETDRTVAANLERVDRSLEARIVQAKLVADELIGNAFDRADRLVGRLDAVARRRIAQVGAVGGGLIEKADKAATELLRKADAVLARRLEHVRSIIHTAIQEADAVAAARIQQLDEVAARRLGTLDVIATKQSLALEATVLRVAALVGLVAFLAFVLWRLFAEVSTAWAIGKTEPTRGAKVVKTAKVSVPRILVQAALAGAGALGMYMLADYLPRGASERAAQQIDQHRKALDEAIDEMSFAMVRYELAQLEVLRPSDIKAARLVGRKAELLERVFVRSATLESQQGVQWVLREAMTLSEAQGHRDPDLLAVQAYAIWQTATTREDEFQAAALCAYALEMKTHMKFHLGPLAHNYLTAFLHDPYVPVQNDVTADDVAALRRIHDGLPAPAEDPRFQHVIELDRLLAALDRDSTAAYFEMLAAHAEVRDTAKSDVAALTAARGKRTEAAQRVIAAWARFDAALESSPWLADDPSALVVFTLNDVVLSQALYFEADPTAADLPGRFLADDGARLASDAMRIKTAPIRVAWGRRYAELLGPNAQEVLAFEETQRFQRYEEQTRRFADAYVEFLRGTRPGKPAAADLALRAERAITAAADLAFYRDRGGVRVLEAAALVEDYRVAAGVDVPHELQQRVKDAYEQRRIRFL